MIKLVTVTNFVFVRLKIRQHKFMRSDEQKVETFNQYRPRLFGIAYRMLGTHAEAEDILQEAYLKWHQTDADEIETPEAWLVTIVTRLSIDRLRKASNERETYIGPWLPEPVIISTAPTPQEELELASNLSMAFMVLLERLSPLERAVFLLHDIFDCGYADIARIVGKTETASRQIVSRARERVRTDKPRCSSNMPIEALVRPLPSELTTPPVTNICFVIELPSW